MGKSLKMADGASLIRPTDLKSHEAAMETWLTGEVVKSYDEFAAAPQTGIPAEEMMARVRAAYQGRRKETGTS